MLRAEISVAQVLAELREIGKSPRTDAAQAAFSAAAQAIAAQARRNIPPGKHPTRDYNGVKWQPGARRKAVKARAASKTSRDLYGGPAAYTFMAIRRGRDRAPHAHLAEFGSQNRNPKGRLLVFENYGRKVFVRRVADQQGDLAFTRAVRTAGPAALDRARRAFQKVIEKSA